MTERQRKTIELFQLCVCDDSFCDVCPNSSEEFIKCKNLQSEVIGIIREITNENDALMADLKAVCTAGETGNKCLACDHYRVDWPEPGCELKGLYCIWGWKGTP